MSNDKKTSETVVLSFPEKTSKKMSEKLFIIPALIVLTGFVAGIFSIMNITSGPDVVNMEMMTWAITSIAVMFCGARVFEGMFEKYLASNRTSYHHVEFTSSRFGLESWDGRKENMKALVDNPILKDEVIKLGQINYQINDDPQAQQGALAVLDNLIALDKNNASLESEKHLNELEQLKLSTEFMLDATQLKNQLDL